MMYLYFLNIQHFSIRLTTITSFLVKKTFVVISKKLELIFVHLKYGFMINSWLSIPKNVIL